MRLIDIEDKALLAELREVERALTIKAAPTVEAVPLVLCKDCRWWENHGATSRMWLPCQVTHTHPNWFCADGERKND